MTRYAMLIDITRCSGCYNCFLACRDEYGGNDYPPYSLSQPAEGGFWMRIIERERGKYPQAVKVAYLPVPCLHCDDPACVRAARNGEIYRRDDGIVLIDPEKSRGQKELLSSCPYRVIYWNEEKQVPQKCTLCAHLLDAGWKEPRCVEACPTGALVFGDLDDPESEIAQRLASVETEVLHPEYGLRERVRYLGLPKRFVAGAVVCGDSDACAEGVSITLAAGGEKQKMTTNNYGDFEFDGLEADREYTVRVEHKGYEAAEYQVNTKTDVYLGEIVLNRKP